MWLYNYLSELRYPRSYLGKIPLVGFLGENCCLGVDVNITNINAGEGAGTGDRQ